MTAPMGAGNACVLRDNILRNKRLPLDVAKPNRLLADVAVVLVSGHETGLARLPL